MRERVAIEWVVFDVYRDISINALTPVPPLFARDEHHLYSTSAGGKDLFNDAKIRVIGLMEPEMCTKMLKKMSEKRKAKLTATSPSCSMVKIGRLDDSFLEVF